MSQLGRTVRPPQNVIRTHAWPFLPKSWGGLNEKKISMHSLCGCMVPPELGSLPSHKQSPRCATKRCCYSQAFFFSRNDPSRSTVKPLIATIAYQIILNLPDARDATHLLQISRGSGQIPDRSTFSTARRGRLFQRINLSSSRGHRRSRRMFRL